jgi:hypothetical protein
MLLSGAFYAYLIGTVCGVIAQRDPASSEYVQALTLMNKYMEENCVPRPFRERVRQYLTVSAVFNGNFCSSSLPGHCLTMHRSVSSARQALDQDKALCIRH